MNDNTINKDIALENVLQCLCTSKLLTGSTKELYERLVKYLYNTNVINNTRNDMVDYDWFKRATSYINNINFDEDISELIKVGLLEQPYTIDRAIKIPDYYNKLIY